MIQEDLTSHPNRVTAFAPMPKLRTINYNSGYLNKETNSHEEEDMYLRQGAQPHFEATLTVTNLWTARLIFL